METNPELEQIEVSERPQNHTTNGNIVQIQKGTREEFYELESEDDLMYDNQSLDDELLRFEVEVEANNNTFTVIEDMSYYNNPSDRSNLGKFVKRYGQPEAGLEVTVDFDEEGEASIVL